MNKTIKDKSGRHVVVTTYIADIDLYVNQAFIGGLLTKTKFTYTEALAEKQAKKMLKKISTK
jgi:hypothetical protein